MNKYILIIFSCLIFNSFSYGQQINRSCFNLYKEQDPFSLTNQIKNVTLPTKGNPPIIETISSFGEIENNNHRWEEMVSEPGKFISQKYYDPETKSYYRRVKQEVNNIVKPTVSPQPIISSSPPIIQPPVYNEIQYYQPQPTFIPAQQLQYFQPQMQIIPSFSGSSRNC